MKAKINRVVMGPSSFDDNPWWDQVANGRLGLRYSMTLSTTVDGVEAEARVTVPAGHWTPDGVRIAQVRGPFPTDKVTGTVSPIDRAAWEKSRYAFTAYPVFEDGEFVGAEGTDPGVIVPACACEAFLNTGHGWSADVPPNAISLKTTTDGSTVVRKWTGANGVTHEVREAVIRGFTTDWLVPPPERVEATVELRAARAKERRGVLGQPPAFVIKHR